MTIGAVETGPLDISTLEFDVLWEHYHGVAQMPLVLRVPSPGRTDEERKRIVRTVWDGLAARGLGTPVDPHPRLVHLLSLLRGPDREIDGRLWLGKAQQPTEAQQASARQGSGVRQSDGVRQTGDAGQGDGARQAGTRQASDARQGDSARQGDDVWQAGVRQAVEERHAGEGRQSSEGRQGSAARQGVRLRLAGKARRADRVRQVDGARQADEARRGDGTRQGDGVRQADEARQADGARQGDEAPQAGEGRQGSEVRLLTAATGDEAVLAVLSNGRLTLRSADATGLPRFALSVLPETQAGPGQSITLPTADFEAAAREAVKQEDLAPALRNRGVRAGDAQTLADMISDIVGRGQYGSASRDRWGRRVRAPRVISFFDTADGRYLQIRRESDTGEPWTTISPANPRRLLQHLTELHETPL